MWPEPRSSLLNATLDGKLECFLTYSQVFMATFLQWIASLGWDSRAKWLMTCAQTLPLGSQSWSSFQLDAGRSRHSHRVLVLWKSAGFFTVSNLSLRICMAEPPRHGACFPDQHISHRSLASAYWMNETNKWRTDWMDVCEKKKSVNESKNEYISESGNGGTHWALVDSPDIQEPCLQNQPLGSCITIFINTSFFITSTICPLERHLKLITGDKSIVPFTFM